MKIMIIIVGWLVAHFISRSLAIAIRNNFPHIFADKGPRSIELQFVYILCLMVVAGIGGGILAGIGVLPARR